MMKKTLISLVVAWSLLSCPIISVGYGQQSKESSADSTRIHRDSTAVAPFGETIFYLHAGIGPFSAAARAAALEGRIRGLADNPFYRADSLHLVRNNDMVNIFYEDGIVTTISTRDSIAVNASRAKIGNERIHAITSAITSYRSTNSKTGILHSIIYSSAVLVLLVLLIYVVNRLFKFFRKRISDLIEKRQTAFSIFGYEFLDKKKQVSIVLFLGKLIRTIIFLLMLTLGLLLMFSILPWTKPFTINVLGVILSPLKNFLSMLLSFLPNLLIILVILTITYYINRFFRFLKREIESGALKLPGFYPEWALPTFNIIRVVVWVFTIILIWPYIPGSDSKIFQGISVFFGLVFSFTSASLLSNVMAGFSLTYTRAFRLGDRVRIGEVTGDVIEKSMLVTKILTIKNEEVTVPNSKIMTSEVVNYSTKAKEGGLILYTSVTIGYDSPWKKIHELLINAALATDGVLRDPPPFVLQTSLDDFYISYQINAYTREPNMMAELYSRLHQNIQDKFNEAGMEIMSPHYKAVRDGNTIAIPEYYRGESYEPPAFRVRNP
jgi:small-conductance mechanosensitive channel